MICPPRAPSCSSGVQIGFLTHDDRSSGAKVHQRKGGPYATPHDVSLARFTTLVLTVATAPYLALADTGDVVKATSDTAAANYGRARGQAYLSSAAPDRRPQALANAYETTKRHVESAYEHSKQFLIDSAHGRASQELSGKNHAWQQEEAETRRPVSSGSSIGAYGRDGIRSYTAHPAEPPRVLSNAYEKTKGYVWMSIRGSPSTGG